MAIQQQRADIVDEAGKTILEISLPSFEIIKPSPQWVAEFKRLLKTQDVFAGVPGMKQFLAKPDLVEKVAPCLRTYVDPTAIASFQDTAKRIRLVFKREKKQVGQQAGSVVQALRGAAALLQRWHRNESAESLLRHATAIESTANLIVEELDGRLKTVKIKQYGRDRQNFYLALSATILQQELGPGLKTKGIPSLLAKLVYAAELSNKNKHVKKPTPAALKKAIARLKCSDWPPLAPSR